MIFHEVDCNVYYGRLSCLRQNTRRHNFNAILTTGLRDTQEFLKLEAKDTGKIFRIFEIFGNSDLFLDNIGHIFETSEYQILSGNDVLKKKVGYPMLRFDVT